MKKLLFPLIIIALSTTSCIKDATCTCKNSYGDILSTDYLKSSGSKVEQFKSDCEALIIEDTVNDVVVALTPCEVS